MLFDPSFDAADSDSRLELFRCRMLGLETLIENETAIDKFKRFSSFKHVFLLGLNQELLESETMKVFL